MIVDKIRRYVWLLDTIYRAGERGITFDEINEKWQRYDFQSEQHHRPKQKPSKQNRAGGHSSWSGLSYRHHRFDEQQLHFRYGIPEVLRRREEDVSEHGTVWSTDFSASLVCVGKEP